MTFYQLFDFVQHSKHQRNGRTHYFKLVNAFWLICSSCGRSLCAFFYYMFTVPDRELIRLCDRIPAVTWKSRNTSQGQLTFQYLYSLPPPANEVGRGVHWFHPVRLSICLSTRLSARLSVRPSVCQSVARLWTWFFPGMF